MKDYVETAEAIEAGKRHAIDRAFGRVAREFEEASEYAINNGNGYLYAFASAGDYRNEVIVKLKDEYGPSGWDFKIDRSEYCSYYSARWGKPFTKVAKVNWELVYGIAGIAAVLIAVVWAAMK